MDNITHSLIGISLADLLLKTSKKEKSAEDFTRFFYSVWIVAFLANNFPDLDYIVSLVLSHRRMNWLLHHRGFTHTLVFAPLQACVVVGLFWSVCRLLKWKWEKKDWILFFLTALSGFILHIFLDTLNSYGTHPFWPLDSTWYYGDTLFIVEPFLWVVFSTFLFFLSENFFLRILFLTISVAAVGLSWFSGYVLWQASLVNTAVLVVSFWFGQKTSPKFQTAWTWGAAGCFIFGFFLVSQGVKIKTTNDLLHDSPGVVVHDIVRTSLPSNPFCWGVVTVESLGPLVSYRMQRGMVSPFPRLISQEDCLSLPATQVFQNAEKMVKASPELLWIGGRDLSIQRLRELEATHCGLSAFLQFSRAPVFQEGKDTLRVWDMRFEMRGKNFTDEVQPLDWKKGEGCPFHAPWVPPRQDLLESH